MKLEEGGSRVHRTRGSRKAAARIHATVKGRAVQADERREL
jgi:hypothetical protein